jgi:hypothetical protein
LLKSLAPRRTVNLSVDDEELVAEDSFVGALVKGREFTKK